MQNKYMFLRKKQI